ncbi:uncharacterized protein LOC111715660 isoform X2 [Eurytemora carolleeae]|uniref:uncharacterized protein LOC111715660 isoform X2 n=1 Tax=Eurytemora carolleeae TaxID=1294199 RepID=UPI000C75EB94|nr:uncharacterized protein LOC111715660 isoform X2 [Eurytemora carolleeae]|eukprot:XP_023346784.1 uncharacterized protein LOC111715660 isoform X2 [Eurytemora affinis]
MEDSGLTLNLNYSAPEKLTVQEHKKQEAATEPAPRKERVDKKDRGPSSRKNQEDNVISSLFNHNPEIPQMILQDVVPTKEDVFSVKSFDGLNLDKNMVKNLKDLG